jgi:gamma-glutamylcyclotransferase (GGCT)/AIG2-like uncharacterized protein YtfP
VARYFAYGSNMSSRRLQERVGSARALGPARLAGMAWRCNKRGADGTAKANLVAEAGAETWGVLFEFEPAAWALLDRAEGGYRRIPVRVETRAGEWIEAETYVSDRLVDVPPAPDYARWILEGAREHGLPAAWIVALGLALNAPRGAGR